MMEGDSREGRVRVECWMEWVQSKASSSTFQAKLSLAFSILCFEK